MAKKRRSAAQKAATRKMLAANRAKRAKKAAPRPARPKSRKRRKASGRTRPVVIRKAGKLYRPRRSSLPSHATFANPLFGSLAMIGNPRRKKSRKAKSSRRRSRRSSRSLSNPISAVLAGPRQMASKDFLTEAASVAAGFVLPSLILPHLPASFRNSTPKAYASKVVVVAALAGGASMINKRVSRAILLGGGVSILLDAWTDFVAPALMGFGGEPAKTGAYYGDPGDPGTGSFFGNPGDPGVGSGIGDAFGGDGEAWG